MTDDEYMTADLAADILGVSPRQVNRYGKGDPPRLRTRRHGRRFLYNREDVLALAAHFAARSVPTQVQPSFDPHALRPLKELAQELGISHNTLRSAVLEGRLQATKFGPILATTRQAIEDYLASRNPGRIPRRLRGDS